MNEIERILNSFRQEQIKIANQNLHANKPITLYSNPPVNEEYLLKFQEDIQTKLPSDYIDFLKINDGAVLYPDNKNTQLDIFSVYLLVYEKDMLPTSSSLSLLPFARYQTTTFYMDLSKLQSRKYIVFSSSTGHHYDAHMCFKNWLQTILSNPKYFNSYASKFFHSHTVPYYASIQELVEISQAFEIDRNKCSSINFNGHYNF
ncbi:SMI1/KNR4 family protein [Paenibacillus agilis]|uniref:SMI1/KNR4 family protein n=1 Tax=Paenibacillus agilis TaxID=3020863 RepID=A0A559IKK1_9BACL|nr:SMI1/KNR4 family protein [Paenibacillus agilis]TVX88161.1 SMI1/KNR4 family protein [Paenibacillus agilis]